MSTFTWRPSFGSDKDVKNAVSEAKFGDGYTQRTAMGINSQKDDWTLKFDSIDTTTAQAIDDFLKARGGYQSFTWVNLDGVSGTYLCKTWKRNYADEDKETISATFERVFGE
jgi:phage-related protein